ncbi:hypothetical protein [Rhizobium sp. RCC_161_2]|uniref:hypothetical protein n=1 Tax=Rhizobium sp. RCC_161_2 TaxID=3239219 RepID=UPI0035244B75
MSRQLPRKNNSKRMLAWLAIVFAGLGMPTAMVADELFAGIWARSCAHLSGETYIFHDGDRLRIVDLECKIVGWKQRQTVFSTDMQCTLDGVERPEQITVATEGDKLRVTMGDRTQLLQHCP